MNMIMTLTLNSAYVPQSYTAAQHSLHCTDDSQLLWVFFFSFHCFYIHSIIN